jgi:phage tail-like protein
MALPRVDPLLGFNFQIALIDDSSTLGALSSAAGALLGGFSECSGLETSLDIYEYAEGGVNDRLHRFPSRIKHENNIVLRRGVGLGEGLWLWHQEFMEGKGRRRTGMIFLFGEVGSAPVPIKTWTFERGLPVKWTGPAFNAQTSEISIEALEIAIEKLTLVSPGTLASAALGSIF